MQSLTRRKVMTYEELEAALATYDDWMKAPNIMPEPTVAKLAEAARLVADPNIEAAAHSVHVCLAEDEQWRLQQAVTAGQSREAGLRYAKLIVAAAFTED